MAVTAEDAAIKSINALQAAAEEACCDCECADDTAADVRKLKELERLKSTAFRQQFMAFFILEAGIILHSVFIGEFHLTSCFRALLTGEHSGLNFGVAGDEWKVLFVVLIFHQSFEGLGIGARMSVIPFPAELDRWLP